MRYSILMPVYNVGNMLGEAIEAVMKQTFRNFELILYNDASTDNSGRICEEYCAQYPNIIKVIHGERNVGVVSARIELLKLAKGDIVVWIDSDDKVKATLLEIIDREFEEKKCDVVIYACSALYDLRFGKTWNKKITNWDEEKIFTEKNKRGLYEELSKGTLNAIWRKAFRRTLFDLALDYEEVKKKVTYGEDLFFTLAVLTAAERIVYLPEILYEYRINLNSITHSYNPRRFSSNMFVLNLLLDYIKIWNLNELKKNVYLQVLEKIENYVQSFAMYQCPLNTAEKETEYRRIITEPICVQAYENVEDKSELICALFEERYKDVKRKMCVVKIKRRLKELIGKLILE